MSDEKLSETPRVDALLKTKPGMWRDWSDMDHHEFEYLAVSLERELAVLKSDMKSLYASLQSESEARIKAEEELAEAGKDAERYRWLRECRGPVAAGVEQDGFTGNVQWLDTTDLDTAIDAALAVEGKEEGNG